MHAPQLQLRAHARQPCNNHSTATGAVRLRAHAARSGRDARLFSRFTPGCARARFTFRCTPATTAARCCRSTWAAGAKDGLRVCNTPSPSTDPTLTPCTTCYPGRRSARCAVADAWMKSLRHTPRTTCTAPSESTLRRSTFSCARAAIHFAHAAAQLKYAVRWLLCPCGT